MKAYTVTIYQPGAAPVRQPVLAKSSIDALLSIRHHYPLGCRVIARAG